jgi:ubiquinone/menaquinone biosynthesis C-methylase UbiE
MNNFILFNNPENITNKLSPLLKIMQESNLKNLNFTTFDEYIDICNWIIRRQEYNFTINTIEKYANNKSLDILDIGCGITPLPNYLSKKYHNVSAIDPIKENIDFLIKNNINNLYGSTVNYFHQYGENLEFEDNSFDVVYMLSVLEHIPSGNDKIVLNQALRVLKPNGILIITTDVQQNTNKYTRDYQEAFDVNTIKIIFDFIENYSKTNTSNISLLEKLQKITKEDIYDFWLQTKDIDIRKDTKREYLAIGFSYIKNKYNPLSTQEQIQYLLQGQEYINKSLHFYQQTAILREQEIMQKEEALQNITKIANTLQKENNLIIIKVLRKLRII